jgi:polar amino acid transport system substrate-binding protein
MTGPSLEAMLESAGSKDIERVKEFKQPIINGKPIQGYGASAFRLKDTEFRDAFNAEIINCIQDFLKQYRSKDSASTI